MADKRSKNKDNQGIADDQYEENVFKSTSGSSHDFDHLQKHFDAATPPPSQNVSAMQAPKDNSVQSTESEEHEQASDAFNDLANAFSIAIPAKAEPSATPANEHDDFAASLEESLSEFESSKPTAAQTGFNSSDFDLSHLHQPATAPSTDDSLSAFDVNDIESATATESNSNALFENESPVYANLSAEDQDEQRPTKQIVAFASALLLTIAGGLYWFTNNDTAEKPAPVVQNTMIENDSTQKDALQTAQQEKISTATQPAPTSTDSKQSPAALAKVPDSITPTANPAHKAKQPNHRGAQPAVQPSQQTAPSQLTIVQPLTSVSIVDASTPSATQTIKKTIHDTPPQLLINQALTPAPTSTQAITHHAIQTKTAPSMQQKTPHHQSAAGQLIIDQPLTLSEGTNSQTTATTPPMKIKIKKSPTPNQLATIQPTTPIQQVNKIKTSLPDENWVVLAPATSNKIARQYMARFKAQHLNSAIVRVQGNGQIHHFIQITGFHSRIEAQKQRDILLNSLGFKGVKINQL